MRNGKRRVELGRYIVADPEICHGKPTFKGTRVMVWQVLEDVADGRSWEFICHKRWGGRIPLAAIAEAVRLSRQAWLDEGGGLLRRPHAKPAEAERAVELGDAYMNFSADPTPSPPRPCRRESAGREFPRGPVRPPASTAHPLPPNWP